MTDRPNRSIIQLRRLLKDAHINGTIPQTAIAICDLIDHFNQLHWHDRDRQAEEIRSLKARIHKLENRKVDE